MTRISWCSCGPSAGRKRDEKGLSENSAPSNIVVVSPNVPNVNCHLDPLGGYHPFPSISWQTNGIGSVHPQLWGQLTYCSKLPTLETTAVGMSTQSLQNFSQSISASSWCPGSVATVLCQAVGVSLKLWLVNNGDHHNRSYRSIHKPQDITGFWGHPGPQGTIFSDKTLSRVASWPAKNLTGLALFSHNSHRRERTLGKMVQNFSVGPIMTYINIIINNISRFHSNLFNAATGSLVFNNAWSLAVCQQPSAAPWTLRTPGSMGWWENPHRLADVVQPARSMHKCEKTWTCLRLIDNREAQESHCHRIITTGFLLQKI